MAKFIYKEREHNGTPYVKVVAKDGDELTTQEALIVAIADLDLALQDVRDAVAS